MINWLLLAEMAQTEHSRSVDIMGNLLNSGNVKGFSNQLGSCYRWRTVFNYCMDRWHNATKKASSDDLIKANDELKQYSESRFKNYIA